MVTKTEALHAGAFIKSEANGNRSREQIVVLSGENLAAGAVLGKVTLGAASAIAAAVAGNTGTGALTLADPATGAGVKAGVYRLTCIEPATDAGKFQIEDPDGIVIGVATVAVAYDGVVKFTIADATDFVAGDSFTITVTIAGGSGKCVEWDPTATDGSQVAAGVLFDAVDASAADAAGVAVVRDAEVEAAALAWFSGATTDNKTAGKAGLAALGIIAR